jgi:putative NADH-flavin reductase
MRIVLLGATGFVGSALLVEALHRGHKVTAIVRHPEKLEKRDGLTATAGDVYDTDSLASLIAGHDALISAFNPGWTPGTVKPEMYDEQVRGTSSIIAAARKAGIKRVLWVGGAGGWRLHRAYNRSTRPASRNGSSLGPGQPVMLWSKMPMERAEFQFRTMR